MTTRVKCTVEASNPNIRVQARPEKIGSSVMGQAPKAVVVAAVSRMGRMRMAPLCKIASSKGSPFLRASWMNSIRTMALRMTMPPNAIMPIMPVAVKKTGSANPPTVFPVIRLSSQKSGHGADQGQGNGHHDEQGHEKGAGLHDEQDVDARQCRGKGDAHVPERHAG
jgi:hypothetical protein